MKNIHLLATKNYSPLVYSPMKHIVDSHHHIYITSDEEIKVGDYCINLAHNIIVKPTHVVVANSNQKNLKKIILTTNQDLDGVQAIDDEFLEWFVKNPSCEEIETERIEDGKYVDRFADGSVIEGIYENYKIIIPKEEPKQETTLEEAAYKNDKYLLGQVKEPSFCYNVFSFKEGAKWQQERSYSEEDVFKLLCAFNYDLQIDEVKDVTEWFEQFKKK